MDNVKFCKDCKHCIPIITEQTRVFRKSLLTKEYKFAKCGISINPDKLVEYLVSGTKSSDNTYYYCSTERNCDTRCGKEGKNFESINETK